MKLEAQIGMDLSNKTTISELAHFLNHMQFSVEFIPPEVAKRIQLYNHHQSQIQVLVWSIFKQSHETLNPNKVPFLLFEPLLLCS